jgi:hypothetical protein
VRKCVDLVERVTLVADREEGRGHGRYPVRRQKSAASGGLALGCTGPRIKNEPGCLNGSAAIQRGKLPRDELAQADRGDVQSWDSLEVAGVGAPDAPAKR